MDSPEKIFVIQLSQIGRGLGVSGETVRRKVRDLEDRGEIEVLRTPTRRSLLNFLGFRRVAENFKSRERAA